MRSVILCRVVRYDARQARLVHGMSCCHNSDASTSQPIQGATVTCYVATEGGEWARWPAENYDVRHTSVVPQRFFTVNVRKTRLVSPNTAQREK